MAFVVAINILIFSFCVFAAWLIGHEIQGRGAHWGMILVYFIFLSAIPNTIIFGIFSYDRPKSFLNYIDGIEADETH